MDALKLAASLEKFASYVDENETARHRETRTQSAARIEKIANYYRALLGEGFTDEMQSKLAGMDDAALAVVEKLANANQPPASLGGAAGSSSPFQTRPSDPLAEFTSMYSGPAR